jgi:hypothetical protein
VVPAGGGDAGVPGRFQDADGQVAQGGHGLGSAAGADLGGVFAVADVAEVVQGLDLPVAADPDGELGGGCLVGVQAGDGVDGGGPPPPAVQRPDLAGEAEGLGGVREGEPGGDGRGLEGAVLLAAMARLCWREATGMCRQGRFLTLAYRPGWFFLTIRM